MVNTIKWPFLFGVILAVNCVHGSFVTDVVAQPISTTIPAGPAGTTTSSSSPANGASTTSPSVAPPLTSTNQTMPPVADAQIAGNEQKRICRTSPQTGTRLRALRVCRTEAQWRQSANETQKSVRVLQGRGGVPTVN